MSKIIFRHKDGAGSIFVEAMNNAGTKRVRRLREALTAAKKRIHERATRIACTGMNRHTRRLIDDNDVFVLVKDIEGYVFRFGSKWRTGTSFDRDAFACTQFMGRL